MRPRAHSEVDGGRMRPRAHAVLLCRVAGLRKAASSVEVEGLGGRAEMERLLSLSAIRLREERGAIPAHLRKAGSFALEGACVQDADARVATVVGLFQAWLFNAGARGLGAAATWQELLRPQRPGDADAKPAAAFPLDDSVFNANEIVGALAVKRSAGGRVDTSSS